MYKYELESLESDTDEKMASLLTLVTTYARIFSSGLRHTGVIGMNDSPK